MKPLPLEIKNLTKCYGTFCAVRDVSFSVKEGEIFGLLGPNGAGKTSIISTITTIEDPTDGVVSVFGHDVTKEPKKAKPLLGCVPQELVHHGFFTVEEILEIYSGFYGMLRNKEQIESLISRLALDEHRHKKIKELSGGLKRRLLIAKALLHKPRLLLLDEPTAGVDVELRTMLWNFTRELRDQGTSILLTTHYLEEAEELCDRVGIIDKGKLKMCGPTKELIHKMTERQVIISLKEPIPELANNKVNIQTDDQLICQIPTSDNIGALMAELALDLNNIQDLKIREGNLEDAFQKVLGSSHEL